MTKTPTPKYPSTAMPMAKPIQTPSGTMTFENPFLDEKQRNSLETAIKNEIGSSLKIMDSIIDYYSVFPSIEPNPTNVLTQSPLYPWDEKPVTIQIPLYPSGQTVTISITPKSLLVPLATTIDASQQLVPYLQKLGENGITTLPKGGPPVDFHSYPPSQ